MTLRSPDFEPVMEASLDFRIRPAARADVIPVHHIEQACYSTPWSEAAFHSLLEREYVLFRVLTVREPVGSPPSASSPSSSPSAASAVVIGFGVLWWGGSEAELANLSVHPDWHGRGGGALLLDTLLAEAGLRGVEEVFLEVRESNQPARALYASRGFVPVGRRARYYEQPTEDALVLSCSLMAGDD
jgi:[ribosomal protein S18]-alanine N-acetyltransferase